MTSSGPRADPFPVEVMRGRLSAVVRPPGSKSLTNRALVCAALADGRSRLDGVLSADDTDAMVGALGALGLDVERDGDVATVTGSGGVLRLSGVRIDARQSGTTARFVLPMLCLADGHSVLDGHPQLRGRPIGPSLTALRSLGARVQASHGESLPVRVDGRGLDGATVELPGDTSSQFLSGLLMAGPCMRAPLVVHLTTALVSEPYVNMTIEVMNAFGARVDRVGSSFTVEASGYRAGGFVIEPDATAASYPVAAAAICGGSVTVEGIGTSSCQGDAAFVDVLETMGARVERSTRSLTVTGPVTSGADVDLSAISDTAPTFAVVAACGVGPSRARGIGFIRAKESDRIGAVVTELRRCGVEAHEHEDGFTVVPGPASPATVQTYSDHRMAMSFALLGLRWPGIAIADPACVAKTYPGFWDMLDALRGPGGTAR